MAIPRLLLDWELVIWTQRLTFAELWTDCATVPAVVLDVSESEDLAAGEAVAEREGVADDDERLFALGEELELAFAEAVLAALLAVLLAALVASSVPVLALLVVVGDFDGVGLGTALLVAEALGVGEAVAFAVAFAEGEAEEDAEGAVGA